MTKVTTRKLSKWREYFRSSTLDIFNIIEYALRVAAIDHPKEFKLNRDKITELIYSFKGFDCDNVVDDKGTKKCEKDEIVTESKDSEVKKGFSNVEVEKLSDEIEEASRVAKEVQSIKKIIDNSQHEADSNIYKSLKRLQLMALSAETLQDTEIGKSVNALKGHNSKNIRYLAKTIVKDWKQMVREWVDVCAAVTEGRDPESTKAFAVDEEKEGFPVPPWEDLAFISTQTTSINFSKILDDMNDDDDDGNVLASKKDNENERKDKKDEQEKKQTSFVKPNKPPGGNSRSGKPTKPTLERKLNNDHEMKLQKKSDKSKIQTRPVSTQQNKLKCPDQDAEHVKLEATKRKLQERYQEVENAKRQRRIQVHDIPKQGHGVRNPQMRQGNHSRPMVNRRQ